MNCIIAPVLFCSKEKCDKECGIYMKQRDLDGKPISKNTIPRPYEVAVPDNPKPFQTTKLANRCWWLP